MGEKNSTRAENEYLTPSDACRVCGHRLDAAVSVESCSGPQEGDASICIECGEVTVFDADLRRLPMPDEEQVMLSEEARRVIASIRLACKMRPFTEKVRGLEPEPKPEERR
jgi:hypothetical protein